jgi:hypothetical protein
MHVTQLCLTMEHGVHVIFTEAVSFSRHTPHTLKLSLLTWLTIHTLFPILSVTFNQLYMPS